VSVQNVIAFGLLAMMMVVWMNLIRRLFRRSQKGSEELASLQRARRELEQQFLDQDNWAKPPKA